VRVSDDIAVTPALRVRHSRYGITRQRESAVAEGEVAMKCGRCHAKFAGQVYPKGDNSPE
jgi:hypothetical protein